MDIDRSKKKFRSTTSTARFLANILIFSGFLLVLAGLFLPAIPEYLSNTGLVSTNAEGIQESIVPNWMTPLSMFAASILVIWMGYILKTVAVLAETQLIE